MNASTNPECLYMAIELASKEWKLAFADGPATKPRRRAMPAGDIKRLQLEIRWARERLELSSDVAVRSCYEAGRDGFWVHRALTAAGIQNVVVDPASLDVDRRARRAKTDRLDADRLLSALIRHCGGEARVWSVVRVPELEAEDARHVHRELEVLVRQKTQQQSRIRALLATQGIVIPGSVRKHCKQPETLRCWDGRPLPAQLRARLGRELDRLELVCEQLRAIRQEQKALIATASHEGTQKAATLARVRGIGAQSAWLLSMEFFAWREFRNRRQVGGLAGLTGTPYNTGNSRRDQGVGKAGNRRVRALMVELAWLWLRYQPASHLSRWYHQRCADGTSRIRRASIVALARKLLIALWRFVDFGEVPPGAQLKPADQALRW